MVLDGEIAATRKSPAVADLACFEGGGSNRNSLGEVCRVHRAFPCAAKPGDQQRAVYLKDRPPFPDRLQCFRALVGTHRASLATRRRGCALRAIRIPPGLPLRAGQPSGPPGFAITDRSTCSARRIERARPSSRRRAFASRQPDASQRS
jgi:hypothetical protein